MKPSVLAICVFFSTGPLLADEIDCSEAYSGNEAKCERVACDEKYKEYVGVWAGPFLSYSDELSFYDKLPDDGITVEEIPVYRPYFSSTAYSAEDCLKNLKNGEIFAIGRRTDTYPEFTSINFNTEKTETLPAFDKSALIIMGTKGSTPFLRTIDKKFGTIEYKITQYNKKKNISVWESTGLTWGVITITNSQDFSSPAQQKRSVVVKMKRGSWEGVISRGVLTKTSN